MMDTVDDSDAEPLVHLTTAEENVYNKTIIDNTIKCFSIDIKNDVSIGAVSTNRLSSNIPVRNIISLYKSRLLNHTDIVLMDLIRFLDDHSLLLLASTCHLLYRLITSQRMLWAYRYQSAFSLGTRVYQVADHTYKTRSVDERELAWLRWWWRCEQIQNWHHQDAVQLLSPNVELGNLYRYMPVSSTPSNSKLLLNWHRAYIARLLVEFNLCNGLFKRRHGTISIPTIVAPPSKTRANLTADLSTDSSSNTESHGWIMRPVGLWGTIIRHPRSQQFALLRHLPSTTASTSMYNPPTTPYPSMHVTLLDWYGLDPTCAWCKITESYLLAAESVLARQLRVWLLKPPRFSNIVDDEPNIPFLVDVPGQVGDRFGISVHGNWCLVYIRPCNTTQTNGTNEGDDTESIASSSSLSITTQQRRIYAYHLPTRLWGTGSCIGREGQAHLQTMSNNCVYVYTCHIEDTISISNTDQVENTDSNNTNDPSNPSSPSNNTPSWMLRQQIIRWRVWELGLYTVSPRCVASGCIPQYNRSSRWIHACRVDDSRVVLYTSRDIDMEDMLLMHVINQFTKNNTRNSCISSLDLSNSSIIESEEQDSVLWQTKIRGILTVSPMLSVGYICVHDRTNRIQLLSLETGVFIHSLLFDGHRPAGQLIGRTYLMNMSNSSTEQQTTTRRNSSRRNNRSRKCPSNSNGKAPSFEKGASQILDLERGMPVHSIASMISPTIDEESTDTPIHRKQNWEVCCSYALRINDVRTITNESDTSSNTTTTDVDLEWLEFTNH